LSFAKSEAITVVDNEIYRIPDLNL